MMSSNGENAAVELIGEIFLLLMIMIEERKEGGETQRKFIQGCQ